MKESLLISNRAESLRLIRTGFVNPSAIPTSDQMYNQGRRYDSGEANLENASIYHCDVDPHSGLYLFPKRTPYIREPGLDNILYFAQDNKSTPSIDNVLPEHLQLAFQTLESVQLAYHDIAPIIREVISINYHDNPILDKNVFGKKVSAQSLSDLHFHAFSFTEEEINNTTELPYNSLKKSTKDYLIDPFSIFVSRLASEPSIKRMLLKETQNFQISEAGDYEGIPIDIGSVNLSSATFCRDLCQLHRNVGDVYKYLVGLYVNFTSYDKKLMPIKYDEVEIESRMEEFLQQHPIDAGLRRNLYRVGKILKLAEGQSYPGDRVFLRGLAYVLYIVKNGGGANKLYFSPKLFSTGNAISALGYLSKNDYELDDEWLRIRDIRQKEIGMFLGEHES